MGIAKEAAREPIEQLPNEYPDISMSQTTLIVWRLTTAHAAICNSHRLMDATIDANRAQ